MPNLRELTAPELVRKWKSIVNEHVMMGRDAHLFKEALLKYTPVQIVLGMYRIKEYTWHSTITIPQFLRSQEWFEPDETWAEIELAACLSNSIPPEYYTYTDLCEEENAYAFQKSLEARLKLRDWADRIIG